MHNHDDKHPEWSESEISISVLIHIRIFIPRKNGVKSINELERAVRKQTQKQPSVLASQPFQI